ncbi:hypothetical protein EVAR_79545_1 [Eumeta japonica]|uniref:Uncharacterized protein n=1 Tax=Eumeta variegata TaxID=151549 RepID=A0A4C1Y7E2_EUMVA|nr:hypothetical protein EVAR_79545_1 [Eumeta japonica]
MGFGLAHANYYSAKIEGSHSQSPTPPAVAFEVGAEHKQYKNNNIILCHIHKYTRRAHVTRPSAADLQRLPCTNCARITNYATGTTTDSMLASGNQLAR